MGARRVSLDQEAAIIAAVKEGQPVKAVAVRVGLSYTGLIDLLHRNGISPKATDDPDRLAVRRYWRETTRAMRERREAES